MRWQGFNIRDVSVAQKFGQIGHNWDISETFKIGFHYILGPNICKTDLKTPWFVPFRANLTQLVDYSDIRVSRLPLLSDTKVRGERVECPDGGVRFGSKVGPISPKWDKSGTFIDQNVLKSDLKKVPNFFPFGADVILFGDKPNNTGRARWYFVLIESARVVTCPRLVVRIPSISTSFNPIVYISPCSLIPYSAASDGKWWSLYVIIERRLLLSYVVDMIDSRHFGKSQFPDLSVRAMTTRDVRFGSKVDQIGPKWNKSGTFSDQMYWNLIWKSPGFVPLWANLTQFVC